MRRHRSTLAKKTVKVGIILTYSGADASIGEAIDRAAELYLKLHRQDLRRTSSCSS
jgi:hypothetical protein